MTAVAMIPERTETGILLVGLVIRSVVSRDGISGRVLVVVRVMLMDFRDLEIEYLSKSIWSS